MMSLFVQPQVFFVGTIHQLPRSCESTCFSRCPLILSKQSTSIVKVPLPPVMLLRCFKYPTISFNGTFARIIRGRLIPSISPFELPASVDPKGSGGVYIFRTSMGELASVPLDALTSSPSSPRDTMWPPLLEEIS